MEMGDGKGTKRNLGVSKAFSEVCGAPARPQVERGWASTSVRIDEACV